MPLKKCIQSHTNREYLTWMAHFGEQWNEPDRTDHYLMRIIQTVRSIFENNVSLDDCKIDFKPAHDERKTKRMATPEERERYSQMAKAAWKGRLGLQKKTPPRVPMKK